MPVVHVAVAVIQNAAGEVLIQQRHEESHQGGLWEFPGGKLESDETVFEALEREVSEELNIRVASSRPLIRIAHDYGDRSVLLDVHRVLRWTGEPSAMENQPLCWVKPGLLTDYTMPDADKPIIKALNLPDSYIITPAHVENADQLLQRLDHLLLAGERLFLYRVRSLNGMRHEALVSEINSRCNACNAKLIIHEKNRVTVPHDEPVSGLHLTEAGLGQPRLRLPKGQLLSVSCHSLATLKKAEAIGADFAMLSPVEATSSHPGEAPIGWQAFAEIVSQVNLPVYALGGMTPDKTAKAWQYGAQGVAGISSWWKG